MDADEKLYVTMSNAIAERLKADEPSNEILACAITCSIAILAKVLACSIVASRGDESDLLDAIARAHRHLRTMTAEAFVTLSKGKGTMSQ